MILEATINGVCFAVGSAAGALAVYLKTRANNHNRPNVVCVHHEAMHQKVDETARDVKSLDAKVDTISTNVAFIRGKMERE